MSRAQRCHRGWRGCLLSRAAIGSPSGCRRDRRHCLRHANSGTSRRGSTARVVPSRSVSPCRACVCLFFSRYPSPSLAVGDPLGLSLSRVRDLFFVRPLPSSLPSSRQNRRPYLSRPALSLGASPLALYPTALARTPAFSSHRRASRLSFSPRCFATASRTPIPTTPMLQDAGVPPPPATGDGGVPRAHNPSTKRAIRNN